MSSWSEEPQPIVQMFEYADAAARVTREHCTPPSTDSKNEQSAPLTAAEQRAYERGRKDGTADSRERFDEELRANKRMVQATIEAFADERRAYFEQVESEVVQLSLAIARRVIGREAKIDKCLLGAMVRIALERIDSRTRVRVRVRPETGELWKREFEWAQNDSIEWLADNTLKGDVCHLETELGSTVVGIEPQLKEIEQGFFDLLSHKPAIATHTRMQ